MNPIEPFPVHSDLIQGLERLEQTLRRIGLYGLSAIVLLFLLLIFR
jgi:hypothetical protein